MNTYKPEEWALGAGVIVVGIVAVVHSHFFPHARDGWQLSIIFVLVLAIPIGLGAWRLVRVFSRAGAAKPGKPGPIMGRVMSPKAVARANAALGIPTGRSGAAMQTVDGGRRLVLTPPPGIPYAPGVFGTYDEPLLVVGPPGRGKSAWLVSAILTSPGPAVVTSVKAELVALTAGAMLASGRPVAIFDVGGYTHADLSGLALRWSPVEGCSDLSRARRMASALVRASSIAQGNDPFWAGSAEEIMTWMLHVAALEDLTMDDVCRWGNDEDGVADILGRIARLGLSGAGRLQELTDTESGGYGASLRGTFRDVLRPFYEPAIKELTAPDPRGSFDVDEFVARRGVVYVVGSVADQAVTSPVIAAFVEDLVTKARKVASPLRPPLSLWLDEFANLAPLPSIAEIMTTGRGEGIFVAVIVQDAGQIENRYGPALARAIRTAATTELTFGGAKHAEYLDVIQRLSGERTETSRSDSWSDSGRTRTTAERQAARITPADLAALPRHHALYMCPGAMRIVRLTPWWEGPYARVVTASATWAARQHLLAPGGAVRSGRGRPMGFEDLSVDDLAVAPLLRPDTQLSLAGASSKQAIERALRTVDRQRLDALLADITAGMPAQRNEGTRD